MGYSVSWAALPKESLSNIVVNNAIQTKGHTIKKCTVGIDAHKESNVLALAFKDMKPSTVYGKISTDLNRTVDAIRKIQKKGSERNGTSLRSDWMDS